jgi:outer membrane beta-barrel protein
MACSRAVTGSVAALLVMTLLSVSRVARADDDVDTRGVETYVVQERLFRLGLELNAGVGLLPLNAFSKGVLAEGSVTYHFSNLWAWEIAQGGYVLANMDTGLKDQLLNNFGVQPTQLSRDVFLVSSNIVFTPFYGKLAGLNRGISHVEVSFPLGPAVGRYEDPAAWQKGIDLGIALRWFLGTQVSVRLDTRDYIMFDTFSNFSLTNELLVSLGISVAFGGSKT